MLIRLAGHYLNNPNHIDKLISIKGLPDEWFFRASKYGGKELIKPWEPDVEANIPESVRHLCEPTEITVVFPPIERGREQIIDKVKIIGVRFNFMSQPGQELWEKIERYLERMTPRDQRVPLPVIVAPNHQAAFDPHAVRRTIRGSIELVRSEIPDVDLRTPTLETTTFTSNPPPKVEMVVPPVVVREVVAPQSFACADCPKKFDKQQGLRMHRMKAHAPQPKQTVGV